MPFSSTSLRFGFPLSDGRAIDEVVIVSLRPSTIPDSATADSILETSVGVKSFVELMSMSAVISARASVPTAFVRFCISERSATTDPTPSAIHKKKNKSRRQEERISRRVRLNIKRIFSDCRGRSGHLFSFRLVPLLPPIPWLIVSQEPRNNRKKRN